MRTAALWMILLMMACGEGEEPAATTEPTAPPTNSTTSTTPGEDSTVTTTPSDPALQQMVEVSIAELSDRLAVEPDMIEVVKAEAVTWPDGSLGCPEPGKAYTQAQVDGYQVVLGHEDRVYLFHAGPDARPFFCPSDARDGGHEFVPPPGIDE